MEKINMHLSCDLAHTKDSIELWKLRKAFFWRINFIFSRDLQRHMSSEQDFALDENIRETFESMLDERLRSMAGSHPKNTQSLSGEVGMVYRGNNTHIDEKRIAPLSTWKIIFVVSLTCLTILLSQWVYAKFVTRPMIRNPLEAQPKAGNGHPSEAPRRTSSAMSDSREDNSDEEEVADDAETDDDELCDDPLFTPFT